MLKTFYYFSGTPGHGLYILRNERYVGHMRDEIQIYYFLLDIIKSSTTLQRLPWKAPAAAFVASGAARRRQSTQVLRAGVDTTEFDG